MTNVSNAYQPTMFDVAEQPALGDLHSMRRIVLSDGAWVDVLPGWLTGSDVLLDRLLDDVPWRAEKRQMYERVVDTPRLLCWYAEESVFPHPVLIQAIRRLSAHYLPELGEPFVTAGLCLYRDGRDSVAWHGDRIGRGAHTDTMVAILSVGSERTLMLRPRRPASTAASRADSAGQADPVDGESGHEVVHEPEPASPRHSVRIPSGHGDLLVMGGSCQRTWEHAIPKSAQAVGPRVSIQFRPVGVS
jgi:alkylated DNA repair dioxygenase AlkB